MDREGWTFRTYTDFDEMRADQLRYWQSRPASERLATVAELSSLMYWLKHGGAEPPPFNKTAVRFLAFPEGENGPNNPFRA